MSLAPASSRGAFLKARFAVNGIQCAARSLGTLTAAGRGLLSSMGASSFRKLAAVLERYQLRRRTGTPGRLYFLFYGRFQDDRGPRPLHRSPAPIQNTSPSESSVSSQS